MGLPVHLCIDIEPNDRQVAGDPDADWSATEPCLHRLDAFRTAAQASGRPVHLNWFLRLDPQVREAYGAADYAVRRYLSWWDRFAAAGDELGVHVHAWRKSADHWMVDHGNEGWVQDCVQESLDAFQSAFGRSARCFRFGDHFLSESIVRLLDDRGIRFELTVEPGLEANHGQRAGEEASGRLPDYRALPRKPYHPSHHDYRRRGWFRSRRLWMVPVSTGCPTGDDVLPGHGARYVHLNLAVDHGWMKRICEGLLARADTTHLCWVARTGDFAFPEYRSNFETNLDYLAGRGLRFVRPDEAWD